ncbi:uncharacterized protein LOC134769744 [Penaeus indicus]|uniref:uncharacterized protein LOC134769744 n=1 Tax=Penaeus indicus TaxID=29960 RepID=UPI00300C6F78
MLFCLIAVLSCAFLPSSSSIYINEDCIARRQRTITSPWGNFQLTVWNPPGGETSEPLLTLMAEFYGKDLPDDYTRVLVFREKIEIDVTSSESRSLTYVNINPILPKGWLDFRVELSDRLQIFAPGFNYPLLDIRNQMTVEQLFIEGSNITVNCKDPVAWEVNGEAESVPLVRTGWYNLTILSRSPVFPVLSFGSKDFDLGWDGKAVASRTTHGLPLPAFTEHHISVKCEASEQILECSLMKKGNTNEKIDTVYLSHMIHFFTIKGDARDSFLILMDSQHEQIQGHLSATIENSNRERVLIHYKRVREHAAYRANPQLGIFLNHAIGNRDGNRKLQRFTRASKSHNKLRRHLIGSYTHHGYGKVIRDWLPDSRSMTGCPAT